MESYKNTKLHNHKIYAEALSQIHAGSWILYSVCEKPGPLWTDSGICVSDPSVSYNPSFHTSAGFPDYAYCLDIDLYMYSYQFLHKDSLIMVMLGPILRE